MAKTTPKKTREQSLRVEFQQSLADVWCHWREAGMENSSPFVDLDDCPALDGDAGYNHTLGWVRGVAEAMGWDVLESS